MVKATEKLELIMRMFASPRFRNDVKALRYAAEGYISYAWELCKETGIADLLKRGSTTEKMVKERGIRDKRFLEHVLDFLAGSGVLVHRNSEYRLLREPGLFTGKKYRFLEEFYPNSVEWTHSLRKKARDAIVTGKREFDAGFDHERFLELWDGIMRESPWSFRKIAIQKFSRRIRDGADILDLGCGSGVSTEQILFECRKPVNITGIDQSKTSIEKARTRMEELQKNAEDPVIRKNIRGVELFQHDITKQIPDDKKYDVVFMSLLVNHIPEKKRYSFFANVKALLKDNGTVVVYQFVHGSRFERVPMWVMNIVPTHQDFPFRDEYLEMFRDIFGHVRSYLGGNIVVAGR